MIINGKVEAVCLDDWDINMLEEGLTNDFDSVVEKLSPKNLKFSFYPERAQSSEEIIKYIELHEHKNLQISKYGLETFEEEPNKEIIYSLDLINSIKSKDRNNIIETLIRFALEECPNLEPYLKCIRSHENKQEKKFEATILQEVEKILDKESSFSLKTNEMIKMCNELISCEDKIATEAQINLDLILERVMIDEKCSEDLKNKLISLKGEEILIKCYQIKELVEKCKINNEFLDKLFHTTNLHLILIDSSDHQVKNILQRILYRIDLNEKVFNGIKEKLKTELDKNVFSQLVITLSRLSKGVKYYMLYEGKYF
jgi:hypothetical protein